MCAMCDVTFVEQVCRRGLLLQHTANCKNPRIYRYMKIVLSNTKYSDPTTVILRDRKLQSVIFAWVLTFIFIKYL